jgi:RimJ/RimL family protein N-acetyltransferase
MDDRRAGGADDVILDVPIETERLRLRRLTPDDLAAMHALDADPAVVRWLYDGPCSEDESRRALQRRLDRDPATGLTLGAEVRDAGELVGRVSLTVAAEHRQGEIGFIFSPAHQGKGYATEAAAAVLALAFGPYRLHRVVGRAEARNVASARVLEKLGMRREAHLIENEWVKGEWQSEVIYALLAREFTSAAATSR